MCLECDLSTKLMLQVFRVKGLKHSKFEHEEASELPSLRGSMSSCLCVG